VTSPEFETVAVAPVSDRAPTAELVVMKFGGSSVGDAPRIKRVAARLVAARHRGANVVGVISAMGSTTDELISLAHQISREPDARELDMLLTVGERISCALVAMAINDLGCQAISLTGSQAGIVTDGVHGKAKIVEVRARRIHEALERGAIVLVAGFQGISSDLDLTTLGRGGTDTTAVALAAALGASSCEIYTDVEGVVRSTFSDRPGTWVTEEDERMLEKAIISGVTHTTEEAVYRVQGARPAELFQALAAAHVNVDTIIQSSADVIVFSAPLADRDATCATLDRIGASWSERDDLAKVSVVGAGMKSHPGVAALTFTTLRDLGSEPQFISTSPIKIGFYVRHDEVEPAVRALHAAFELGSHRLENVHE